MEPGKELAQRDVGIALPPEIVLENARIAAKALVSVISLKKHPVILAGEQYLEFEDWQTCGQFYGYTVKTGEAMPVEIDGVKGAKARADLINLKTGEVVGGAEAYCMRDEEKWNTRPKYEWQDDPETGERKRTKIGEEVVPWFQLASMAQTRAGAKAFRNRLAWVVVLAGYRPTPAEEMTESTPVRGEERHARGHWCSIHKVVFFKKGKMTGYAHPIGDTKEWCSEKIEEPKPPASKAQADQDKKDLYGPDAVKPSPTMTIDVGIILPLKHQNPATSAPPVAVSGAPGPEQAKMMAAAKAFGDAVQWFWAEVKKENVDSKDVGKMLGTSLVEWLKSGKTAEQAMHVVKLVISGQKPEDARSEVLL